MHDKQGNLLKEIDTPLAETHGICLAEENGKEILWIADASSTVVKMAFDGTVLKKLVKADRGYSFYENALADIPVGEFNSLHGMACDSNGDIYVSEWMLGDRFTKLEQVSR